MKSNCLIYALKKWVKEGGYIAVRKSLYSPLIPHFIHISKEGVWSSFVPVKPVKGFGVCFHKVRFEGKVLTDIKPL